MKKQARLMQEQFSQMQDQLKEKRVEGSAGNGLVTVVLDGEKELKRISIRPECVNPNDVEGLQDLILAAFESAAQKIESEKPAGMPFL